MKLYYNGHGSFRLTLNSGKVIYVDPFIGEGYEKSADAILITHEHYDHTQTSKMPHSADCVVIRAKDALVNGEYKSFTVCGASVRAVQAYNKNHPKDKCVGYVIGVDGVKLYAAGDTSETEDMHTLLPSLALDYALLPGDGIYNMDIDEAAECAKLIGAKHSIPIHLLPDHVYDEDKAAKFDCPGKMLVHPSEEIEL